MVILLLQEAPLPRHQQQLLLLLLPGSTRAVELWRSFTPVLVPLLLAAATLDDITAATCIVLFVAPPLPSFLPSFHTLVTETVIIIFKLLLDHPKQRKLHESLSLSTWMQIMNYNLSAGKLERQKDR
jgi:hypothetical protein